MGNLDFRRLHPLCRLSIVHGDFGVLDAHLQRTIHLAFGLCLIFLLYPARKSWSREKMNPLDVLFAVLSVGATMYLVVEYQELVLRAGMNTQQDIIIGLIGTILILRLRAARWAGL